MSVRNRNRNTSSSITPSGSTAQNVNVLDLICEGPIRGLVDGTRSVYLDDVPVEDAKFSTFTPISSFNSKITFSGSAIGTVDSNVDLEDLEFEEQTSRNIRLLYNQTTASATSVTKFRARQTVVLQATTGTPFSSAWESGSQLSGGAEAVVLLTHSDGSVPAITGFFRITDGDTATIRVNLSDYDLPSTGTYTITVFYFFAISSINTSNNQITLTTAPTSGTYEFVVGSQIQLDDQGQNSASLATSAKKINKLNLDFRRGDLTQPVTSSVGGVGGSIAVSGNTGLISGPQELKIISQTLASSLGISIFDKEGLPNTNGSKDYPGSPDYSVMADAATVLPSSAFGLDTAVKIEEADEIGFTIKYPALQVINLQAGDKETAYAFYVMQIRFEQEGSYTVWKGLFPQTGTYVRHYGNTNAPVSFDHAVNLDGYRNIVGPFEDFQVRIVRVTRHIGLPVRQSGKNEDDTNKKKWQLSAAASIESLRAVIKDNLSYPYSSIASVSFSSRQFDGVPKRSYLLEGKLVKVPTTYTPREYSDTGIAKYEGFWDGTFRDVEVYTDNPAWVFYDIVTNNRYGAGKWISDLDIDKFALYRIARYCDELVDDGSEYDSIKPLKVGNFYKISTAGTTTWTSLGAANNNVGTIFQATGTTITGTGIAYGVEPRFRANVFLTKATDVYKVFKDFATIFLGILQWQDSKITPLQDAPQDPIYNFTKGNVIDGTFSYESSGLRTRTNQVVVTWNDPTINYEPVPLVVEDRESIVRTGRIISQSAVAFGATSESQAIRYGRWKLWTAQNQTEIISFRTSLAAHYVKPGDVINVQDADRFGVAYSGRTSSATSTTLTFDRNVSFNSGSTYELSTLVTASAALNASDESITINSVTYERGEKIDQAYVYNGSSYVLVNLDTEERASNAFIDSSGSELIPTIWKPYSYVETHEITNPGTSASTVTLANSATFDTTPSKHNIWALKETSGSLNVAGSEKMYKILSISEEQANIFAISAVEYFDEKFTAVEEEYELGVIPISIYIENEPATIPRPLNPRVILATDAKSPGEELILEWDEPDSDSIVQYEVLHNIPELDNPLKTDSTNIILNNVPNGSVTFKIRAISRQGNMSAYIGLEYGVYDPYGANIERVQYGIPKGAVTNSEAGIAGSAGSETFRFLKSSYVIASNGDKEIPVSPNESSQDVSDISADEDYYVFLDANTPTLTLMYYDSESLANMPFWRDVGTGNSASSTSWTSIGSVLVAANDNTVFGTGFNTNVKLRDILNLSGSTSPTSPLGEGAVVISIISDTQLLIDRTFDTQIATTGYRASYRPDYAADAAIARVHKNSSNVFSSENFLTLDPSLESTTRSLTFDLDVQNLTYDKDSTQTNVPSNINASVRAIGYREPEFKIVIPSGMSAAGTQDFALSTGSDTLLKEYVLDNDGAIDYNNGSPLTIVASVREANDPANTVKSSTIVLTKSKDGGTGQTGRVVNLTMGDQTFEYNTEGASPSPSNTTVTATAVNTSDTVYYEFLKNGTQAQAPGTSNTYTYTPPSSYASMPETIEVRIREGSASNPILARDQITVSGLRAGSDAATVILSNEAHTLYTTNTGTVTYTGSGTDIEVWEGTNQVPYDGSAPYQSPSFRVSISSDTGITANSSPSTVSTYIRRYGDHNSMTTDTASIVYNIIVKNSAGAESTFTKTQSFAKSEQGADGLDGADGADGAAGINSRSVDLTAGTIVFTYAANGTTPSPSSTVVTASANNTSGTVYYRFFKNNSPVQHTTSNTYTYTPQANISNMPDEIEVEIREGSTSNPILARDHITLGGIRPGVNGADGVDGGDGVDAITTFYDNQSHTVPVTNTGIETWTGSGGTLNVFDGTNELILNSNTQSASYPSSNGRYNLNLTRVSGNTLNEPAITGSGSAGATLGNFSGNLTQATQYELSIYVKATDGTQYNPKFKISITPSFEGSDGADGADGDTGLQGERGEKVITGYLYYYQAQSSAPTVPATSILSVNWSTGAVSSSSSAWNIQPPTFEAGSTNTYWYFTFTAAESGTYNSATDSYSTTTVTFNPAAGQSAVKGIGFQNLVTFSSLTAQGTTTIDGSRITTGQIDAQRLNVTQINVGDLVNNVNYQTQAVTSSAQINVTQTTNYVAPPTQTSQLSNNSGFQTQAFTNPGQINVTQTLNYVANPTQVSQLQNNAGYQSGLTTLSQFSNATTQFQAGLAQLSQFSNDSGFQAGLSQLSQFSNNVGFQTAAFTQPGQINVTQTTNYVAPPTQTSQLSNNSGFQTQAVEFSATAISGGKIGLSTLGLIIGNNQVSIAANNSIILDTTQGNNAITIYDGTTARVKIGKLS